MTDNEEREIRSVWIMLLLPPLTLAVIIFGYVGLAQIDPSDPAAEEMIRQALPYLLAVNHLSLFGLLLYILRRRNETLRDIGWHVRGSSFLIELIFGVIFALLAYLFKEFGIDSLRAVLQGNAPTFTSLFRFDLSEVYIPLAVAAAGLVFVEESIYRGFAIPRLRSRFGLFAAVGISTFFFGLLHWGNGPFAILSAFLLGLLFAAIYLWRGNVVAVTIAHIGYNLLVLAVT